MSFFVELWESVFTPGTTPALIKATHGSFILLILSLSFLVFLTSSIHFINLLVISVLLYASVIWFVNELQQAKLKANKELEKEGDDSKDNEGNKESEEDDDDYSLKPVVTSAAPSSTSPKKRKV